MFMTNATDIKQWAATREAQSQLPRLIRRLIQATSRGIERIAFPADESVQSGGWDGIAVAKEGNEFVPDGLSVWELGCDLKPNVKADTEYKKRTDNPPDIIRSEATFVFVTPRIWTKKEKWAASKRAEGHWRNVRAFDADDLAHWLETARTVHIWFSMLLGKHPDGATDFTTCWEEWSRATEPGVTEKLVTAGREDAVDKITNWLRGVPDSFGILDETKKQALAFFLSSLSQMPDEERCRHIARGAVVHDTASWRHLVASDYPLILVPMFEDLSGVGQAVKNKHHVLIPSGQKSDPRRTHLIVPRLSREPAERALVEMGCTEHQARLYASLARRSFTAFQRTIAHTGEFQSPKWATSQYAHEMSPVLLIGTWNDANLADRKILEKLANTSYKIISERLTGWLNNTDSPVRRHGDIWMLVSQEDAWTLLSGFLTTDNLKSFETVCVEVLGVTNPEFDLSLSQQRIANFLDEASPHSKQLCQGLANTLALMGSRDDKLAGGSKGQGCADKIVGLLLQNAEADWRIWASLSTALPLLAEAAPVKFLEAVEKDVLSADPILKQLMNSGSDHNQSFMNPPEGELASALRPYA